MNSFPLFLPDFRAFVRNKAFTSAENVHPVFYFESDEAIRFYKVIGYVTYITTVFKTEELPEGITIKGLKTEFQATELPSQPDAPKTFIIRESP